MLGGNTTANVAKIARPDMRKGRHGGASLAAKLASEFRSETSTLADPIESRAMGLLAILRFVGGCRESACLGLPG
jgi:hypothetical protein